MKLFLQLLNGNVGDMTSSIHRKQKRYWNIEEGKRLDFLGMMIHTAKLIFVSCICHNIFEALVFVLESYFNVITQNK